VLVFFPLGMIHSLISLLYDATVKQCTNINLLADTKRKSINNDNPSTVAIGVTPESSLVM